MKTKSTQQKTPNNMIFRVMHELATSIGNPRTLILVSHGFVEMMTTSLVEAKCKNRKRIKGNALEYPHSSKLLILNELGLIPDDLYRSLEWLRKLRNKAARDPVFRLNANDLRNLPDPYTESKNLPEYLWKLLGDFWNLHGKLFSSVFTPDPITLSKQAKVGQP